MTESRLRSLGGLVLNLEGMKAIQVRMVLCVGQSKLLLLAAGSGDDLL